MPYTYRSHWSPEDREHVATVDEFPGLSWIAGTPAAALAGIHGIVAEVLVDMASTGETPPAPAA